MVFVFGVVIHDLVFDASGVDFVIGDMVVDAGIVFPFFEVVGLFLAPFVVEFEVVFGVFFFGVHHA